MNHPTQWNSSHPPIWVSWLFLGIFSWPPLLFWALVRRQERLLSEGRPAPGVITRLKRMDKQLVAYYEFTLLSGQVMKGKSGAALRSTVPGTQVCVLYDPDNPRRNAIYPLKFVKLQRS